MNNAGPYITTFRNLTKTFDIRFYILKKYIVKKFNKRGEIHLIDYIHTITYFISINTDSPMFPCAVHHYMQRC